MTVDLDAGSIEWSLNGDEPARHQYEKLLPKKRDWRYYLGLGEMGDSAELVDW